MELLNEIFRATLLVTGTLFFLTIIIAIITTPFREAKKKKLKEEALNKLFSELEKLNEEMEKELEKEKKTTKRTRKSKEK